MAGAVVTPVYFGLCAHFGREPLLLAYLGADDRSGGHRSRKRSGTRDFGFSPGTQNRTYPYLAPIRTLDDWGPPRFEFVPQPRGGQHRRTKRRSLSHPYRRQELASASNF